MAQPIANTTDESTEVLRQLESKMSGILGVVDTLSRKVDETNDMFVETNSAYFLNMASAISSSLHESEMDRRLYEEAMEQNRRAAGLSGKRSPERGDANFWETAFAPTPVSQAEMQASAMKATFSDRGVMDAFRNMFSGIGTKNEDSRAVDDIVKDALRGNADDRTFGEKALDKIGLGAITKAKNWLADWNVRKEEKATAKDQGTIKREQKLMDRLSAKYRKMKAAGATEDELAELQEQFNSHRESQVAAASRIRERRNDDLYETAMPTGQQNQAVPFDWNKFAESFKQIIDTNTAKAGTAVTPGVAVSAALAPPTRPVQVREINDADIVGNARTRDIARDRNEPVELAKGTEGSLAPVGDTKEAADIQRRLDTTLRPDFYREGTAFFKKANSGELLAGLSSALGGGLSGAAKAGMYAAAATAVVASVAKIGEAAMLVKDWYGASNEAVENVKQMTERNNANLEKRKNGVNDDLLAATQASNTADQELHESEESFADSVGSLVKDNALASWLGFKSDRKKKREAAEAANKKRLEENEKYRNMKAAADKAGVNTDDIGELAKFKELYDRGQADRYNPGKSQLAAGNLQESDRQSTVQTPGAKVEPEKAESPAEQLKRQEEAMFNATKRALLDIDVQRKNEENAKIQGREIDQSLNGRK